MNGERFDPALLKGNCPVCGVSTSAQTGDPPIQTSGDQSQGTCSGSGSPSQ